MDDYTATCKDKRRYPTRADAKRSANSIRTTGGPNFKVYACPYCSAHHLGHRPGYATHLRKDRTSPTGSSPVKEVAA